MTAASPRPGASPTELLVSHLFGLIGRLTLLARDGDDAPALTTTQRLALIELAGSGPVRLHTLAERIGASPPTASRAVDGLVGAGFVERVPDPGDRRAVQIRLSAVGREKIASRLTRAAAALEPAVASLSTAERSRLVELLARVHDAVRGPVGPV